MMKKNDFIRICKMEQCKLKLHLLNFLKQYGYNPVNRDGFLYAKGNIPILLTAHMDTVHKECVKKVVIKKGVISSPQGIGGDDRCGIWIIKSIIKHGFRPYILFCEDEEVGSVGADKFCATKYIKDLERLKYFISLDRKGNNEAVFYDCENIEFQNYITEETGYVIDNGSFTDIVPLSEATDVASVNLSVGYYNQHTKSEYVVFEEMQHTIEVVENLLYDEENASQFDLQSSYSIPYPYTDVDENGSWIIKTHDDEWFYANGKNQLEAIQDFLLNSSYYTIFDITSVEKDDWWFSYLS